MPRLRYRQLSYSDGETRPTLTSASKELVRAAMKVQNFSINNCKYAFKFRILVKSLLIPVKARQRFGNIRVGIHKALENSRMLGGEL